MDIIAKCSNLLNTLGTELVHTVWAPLVDVSLAPDRGHALVAAIPRSNEGIDGIKLSIPMMTELPWGWRAMSETGYTPSASKYSSSSMTAQLACFSYTMMVGLFELEHSKASASEIKNLVDLRGQWMVKAFPYFLRAMLFSPMGSLKAVGQVVSVATSTNITVTIDNAGLWNTATKDRAKLIEPGMYLQAYRSSAKLGAPFKVTSVAKAAGTFTIDADPGLADNDLLVLCDIGGLDVPYPSDFPGFQDLLDDDNEIQGTNRALAANAWARSNVVSGSGGTFGRAMLTDFFNTCYMPAEAFCHPDMINAYFTSVLADQVRYADTRTFSDGVVGLTIDNTVLKSDWDMDRDKVFVPAFAESGIRLADKGAAAPLFGLPWQQIGKRPFLEQSYAKWMMLIGEDFRKTGILHTVTLPS